MQKDTQHIFYSTVILNEVEADIVYMQNKVIGQNHLNWQPNYVYKAWYKAKNEIHAGANVTPKTDIGAYVIQKTGDITFQAGEKIFLEPGFSTEPGARFEAEIYWDGCYRSEVAVDNNNNQTSSQKTNENLTRSASANLPSSMNQDDTAHELQLFPNPNTGDFTVILPQGETKGTVVVNDVYGKTLFTHKMNENRMKMNLGLPKGIYFLHYSNTQTVQTLQFVVQ